MGTENVLWLSVLTAKPSLFTVEPAHPKFRQILSRELGFNEAELKSSADKYSLEELRSIHDQVIASID